MTVIRSRPPGRIKGVQICRADVRNLNGRIYPSAILEQFVKDKKGQSVKGELSMQANATIDISNVSHVVHDLRMRSGWLVGDVEVLCTPNGWFLQNLLDAGFGCFRLKGIADFDHNQVVTMYQLISIDHVKDGS